MGSEAAGSRPGTARVAIALAAGLLLALGACRDGTSGEAGITGSRTTSDGAAAASGGAATEPPLAFDAPPGYASAVARLREIAPERLPALIDLVGLREGGAVVRIVLAPEGHPLARGVPPGIAGYAVAERDLAVLLPERVPRYPYDSLDVLFLHEMTHVLLGRATRGRPLPRWWNEGLALLASRGWSLGDHSRVLYGAVAGVPADTAALEASFEGDARRVSTAYALSGALVHDLARRHGADLVSTTSRRVAAGEDFEAAFAAVTGRTLSSDVERFWRRYLFWYRWLPFVTSGTALWLGITALVIVAGVRRRQRDAALRRRWEAEESAIAAASERPDRSTTVH